MSSFEAVLAGLLLVGVVVPMWLLVVSLYFARKRPSKVEAGARFFAYAKLFDELHNQIRSGRFEPAQITIAAIRTLTQFPEFADLSVLYLEELTVDGSGKMDKVLKNEISAVEAQLLELNNV